jgi:hypothetical protein
MADLRSVYLVNPPITWAGVTVNKIASPRAGVTLVRWFRCISWFPAALHVAATVKQLNTKQSNSITLVSYRPARLSLGCLDCAPHGRLSRQRSQD